LARFLACLCAAFVLGLAAAHAQKSITVDALDFVRAAIATGKYDAARRVLSDLLRANPADVEANFLLAETDLAQHDDDAAITRFRMLLVDHPAVTRIRLDYALALFDAQDDDNAEYNFRLTLAADLPDTVRDNVLRYLHAIRARRRYQVSVAASIAPDTNINSGTSVTEVSLFGLPFTPSQSLEKKSGVGAVVQFSGEYRYPVSEDIRWRANALLWRAEYPGGQFDDMVFRTETGPQWLLADWDLSALGVYTQSWYGNDPFYAGAGPRVEAVYHGFARWRIEADAEDLFLGYHTERFENGDYISANLYPNFYFDPTTFLRPIIGVFQEQVASSAFAATGYRLGMGFHHEFPRGISMEFQGEVYLSYYDAQNALFGTTRRDQTLRLQASIYRRDWIIFGFNPVLTYIFTRNDSNQDLFAYRRNQVQVGFTKDF
jgi:outer membrane protein